jgi:GT2 family glycosyltransferase
LEKTGADNVGGLQRVTGENLVSLAISLATRTPLGIGNAKFRYSKKAEWVDTVYLGAYKREVFERIGNFDENLVRNQDDEFNFRLSQAGGRIWIDPSIKVTYYSRNTFRRLWKQYFQY